MPSITHRAARASASVAGAIGAVEFLSLMGAFGPVSCWRSQTEGGTASAGGASSSTGIEVSTGCNAGIDYLLSGAGGNAPVLFAWSVVLLAMVSVGVFGVWTGRRGLLWTAVAVGIVVSIIGIMSIGMYFAIPTLFLLAAGLLLRFGDGPDATDEDEGASAAA